MLNTTALSDDITNMPSLSSIDYTAPEITLNLIHFRDLGDVSGQIYDPESLIPTYSFIFNGANITDLAANITIDSSVNHYVYFNFTTSMFVNGSHNYLLITTFNDGATALPLSLSSGGGTGGSGGFTFCDDPDCWGPMPLLPKTSHVEDKPFTYNALNDTSGPLIKFDITSFRCCGTVSVENITDSQGVDTSLTTINNYPCSVIARASNLESVQTQVTVLWDQLTGTVPSSYEASMVIVGLLSFAVITIFIKRRRK